MPNLDKRGHIGRKERGNSQPEVGEEEEEEEEEEGEGEGESTWESVEKQGEGDREGEGEEEVVAGYFSCSKHSLHAHV